MYLYPARSSYTCPQYTDTKMYNAPFSSIVQNSRVPYTRVSPAVLRAITLPEIGVDYVYKRNLLRSMGLENVSVECLRSVMGPAEFKNLVQFHTEDPEFYKPGTRPLSLQAVPDSNPLTNVKNKKFGANLHIHTTASDGVLSIRELLEQSVEYANEYAVKNKKPFTIAITDHNTVEGCKDAVRIISKNPHKYRNLRVVLGAEISAKEDEIFNYKFKKPEKFHVLTMCVNPFDKELNSFIEDINMGHSNPMNPRTVRVQEVVDMLKSQPSAYLAYAHPAYPDLKHRIVNPTDDYVALNKDCVRFFAEKAGKKALYAEVYYGGYQGSMSLDKKLFAAIKEAVEECGLLKAGGLDTHGNSVFRNGQQIVRRLKHIK